MNKFLESASERYPEVLSKTLISPISKTDAEIISLLIDILRQTSLSEVYSILDSYKYLKDSDILKMLQEYSLKHITLEQNNELSKDSKSKTSPFSLLFRRDFIYLRNYRLEVSLIKSYEKSDDYSYVSSETEYKIIINKLPETTTVVGIATNKIIKYQNMESRDRDFESLDNYMSKFGGINFINERNGD